MRCPCMISKKLKLLATLEYVYGSVRSTTNISKNGLLILEAGKSP
jgi:hypothetical protein